MEQLSSIVDFEIAKLLNDKGFQLDSYLKIDDVNPKNLDSNFNPKEYQPWYLNLTIAQTIDWIYDKHGIWISSKAIKWNYDKDIVLFNCIIYKFNKKDKTEIFEKITDYNYNSPKAAYYEAIKYVLNNLI